LVLAIEHPERLHGIVLAATAPYLDIDTRTMGQRWMDIYQREGVDAYLSRVVKDIFTLDYFLAHEKEVDEFLLSQKHRNFAGIAPSALGNIGFDVRGELPKIHLPTLVIHGLSDRVIDPAYARRIRQSVVGAEVKLLDSGHIVNIEAKEEFNQIVEEFISRGATLGS
jgi:pimeloyl-ACP methyl ester carboxylesterase